MAKSAKAPRTTGKRAVTSRSPRRDAQPAADDAFRYCAVPETPEVVLPRGIDPDRARAIIVTADKWVNGTVIHYYFFNRNTDGSNVRLANGTVEFRTWVGAESQRKAVRDAFAAWKALGIGLVFKEVDDREEAELRIGFMRGDGAWSYIGTQALNRGPNERTINYGWNLTTPDGADTALHEIGHAIGLPHEHQNPNAGIVWDEEAVYASLARPPNSWDRQKTFHNIIRKIAPDTVQGSAWDPDSIMHYPFGAGLIKQPTSFRNGLQPQGGLSSRDLTWVRSFYPALSDSGLVSLKPSQSQELGLRTGEQKSFLVTPTATRRYDIRTFGNSDTLMVLFEERAGTWRFLASDDDSGEDRNASLRVRLVKGHRYAVRVRMRFDDGTTTPTIMLW